VCADLAFSNIGATNAYIPRIYALSAHIIVAAWMAASSRRPVVGAPNALGCGPQKTG
jgi:hypothetical protein